MLCFCIINKNNYNLQIILLIIYKCNLVKRFLGECMAVSISTERLITQLEKLSKQFADARSDTTSRRDISLFEANKYFDEQLKNISAATADQKQLNKLHQQSVIMLFQQLQICDNAWAKQYFINALAELLNIPNWKINFSKTLNQDLSIPLFSIESVIESSIQTHGYKIPDYNQQIILKKQILETVINLQRSNFVTLKNLQNQYNTGQHVNLKKLLAEIKELKSLIKQTRAVIYLLNHNNSLEGLEAIVVNKKNNTVVYKNESSYCADIAYIDSKILVDIIQPYKNAIYDVDKSNYLKVKLGLDKVINSPFKSMFNFKDIDTDLYEILKILRAIGGQEYLETIQTRYFAADNPDKPQEKLEEFLALIINQFYHINNSRDSNLSYEQIVKGILEPLKRYTNRFSEKYNLKLRINKQTLTYPESLYKQCVDLLEALKQENQTSVRNSKHQELQDRLDAIPETIETKHITEILNLHNELKRIHKNRNKLNSLQRNCHELLGLLEQSRKEYYNNLLQRIDMLDIYRSTQQFKNIYAAIVKELKPQNSLTKINYVKRCETLINLLPESETAKNMGYEKSLYAMYQTLSKNPKNKRLKFIYEDLLKLLKQHHQQSIKKNYLEIPELKSEIYSHAEREHTPEAKHRHRGIKKWLINPGSVISSFLLASGQAIISVVSVFLILSPLVSPIAASAIALAMGVSTLYTNYNLVQNDTRKTMIQFFLKGDIANGFKGRGGYAVMLTAFSLALVTGLIMGVVTFLSALALPASITFIPAAFMGTAAVISGVIAGVVGVTSVIGFSCLMYVTCANVIKRFNAEFQQLSLDNIRASFANAIDDFLEADIWKKTEKVLNFVLTPLVAGGVILAAGLATISTLGAWHNYSFKFLTEYLPLSHHMGEIASSFFVFGLSAIVRTTFNFNNVAVFFSMASDYIVSNLIVKPSQGITNFVKLLVTDRPKLSSAIKSTLTAPFRAVKNYCQNLYTNPGLTISTSLQNLANSFKFVSLSLAVIVNGFATATLSVGGFQRIMDIFKGVSVNSAKGLALSSATSVSISSNAKASIGIFNTITPTEIKTRKVPLAAKKNPQAKLMIHMKTPKPQSRSKSAVGKHEYTPMFQEVKDQRQRSKSLNFTAGRCGEPYKLISSFRPAAMSAR